MRAWMSDWNGQWREGGSSHHCANGPGCCPRMAELAASASEMKTAPRREGFFFWPPRTQECAAEREVWRHDSWEETEEEPVRDYPGVAAPAPFI